MKKIKAIIFSDCQNTNICIGVVREGTKEEDNTGIVPANKNHKYYKIEEIICQCSSYDIDYKKVLGENFDCYEESVGYTNDTYCVCPITDEQAELLLESYEEERKKSRSQKIKEGEQLYFEKMAKEAKKKNIDIAYKEHVVSEAGETESYYVTEYVRPDGSTYTEKHKWEV